MPPLRGLNMPPLRGLNMRVRWGSSWFRRRFAADRFGMEYDARYRNLQNHRSASRMEDFDAIDLIRVDLVRVVMRDLQVAEQFNNTASQWPAFDQPT